MKFDLLSFHPLLVSAFSNTAMAALMLLLAFISLHNFTRVRRISPPLRRLSLSDESGRRCPVHLMVDHGDMITACDHIYFDPSLDHLIRAFWIGSGEQVYLKIRGSADSATTRLELPAGTRCASLVASRVP